MRRRIFNWAAGVSLLLLLVLGSAALLSIVAMPTIRFASGDTLVLTGGCVFWTRTVTAPPNLPPAFAAMAPQKTDRYEFWTFLIWLLPLPCLWFCDWLVGGTVASRLKRPHCCPICEYDIRVTRLRCPECGTDLRQFRRMRASR